jgi:pimeloyl-ACP methyl ester carboxylesterase
VSSLPAVAVLENEFVRAPAEIEAQRPRPVAIARRASWPRKAGRGLPLVFQHTAGAHGSQWRHLFEEPRVTDRFRLITYDLPYHGKSLPPDGKKWWAEEYRLSASGRRTAGGSQSLRSAA